MFIKFVVRKERGYDVNGNVVEEQELTRFNSYEEAENYILNYNFPDNVENVSEMLELSINKVYSNLK